MNDIGDRMKRNYEAPSRHLLTRRVPVIVRVDGRAFHTFTRGMEKPFSQRLIDAMVNAACSVSEDMQGFKLGYVQSDEASFLLTDYDELTTEPWFGYVQSKVETAAASMMTAAFNYELGTSRATFDARAFNIPEADVANYFLWRMKDWERNSVSMYCNASFSAKEMHGKGRADQHEMLYSVGKNWTKDLSDQIRNGTVIMPGGSWVSHLHVPPEYRVVSGLIADSLAKKEVEA